MSAATDGERATEPRGRPAQVPIVAASSEVAVGHTIRGGLANLLGLLARLVRPVFWIVATRLYGAARVGEFAVAVALLELARQFTSSGTADAVVLFVARGVGRADERDRVYNALANAILLTLVTGGAVVAWVLLGGHRWVAGVTQRRLLDEWVPLLVWGVPLLAMAETLVAATRAHMVMRWSALVLGGLQPLLQLAFLVGFHLLGFEDHGLAWAWLLGLGGTAVCALAVFGRYFEPATLARRMLRPKWHGEMMRFVWPQSANMTFNYFATNLDLVMLGMFGVPSAQLALYNAGVQLTRNLQSIKVAFGTSFAPVVARFHLDGRTDELNDMLQKLSRLSLVFVLPVTLVVGALHQDLLRLFDPGFTQGTGFVFPLLVIPVATCALGLAGTVIVMASFVRWNLFNSILAAGLNVGFNLWLIPRWGLWGSAMATLLATAVVRVATLVEFRFLLGVPVNLAGLARPAAIGAVGAAGLWWTVPRCDSHGERVLCALAAVVVYSTMVWRLAMTAEERTVVRSRIRPPWGRAARGGPA